MLYNFIKPFRHSFILVFYIFQIEKLQMSSTQGPTNFNQPQSLVKYSNPVLVSSSGKKQVKVNTI